MRIDGPPLRLLVRVVARNAMGGSGEPIPSGSLLRTLPGGAWALVPFCFQSGMTAQAF